jgi:hypothetical protein
MGQADFFKRNPRFEKSKFKYCPPSGIWSAIALTILSITLPAQTLKSSVENPLPATSQIIGVVF